MSAPSYLIADVKCLTYYLLSPRHTNCVELDIGHPCYDILTAVRIGYLLTGVTWLYHWLKVYNPLRWHVFFKVLCWPVKVFKIAGSENFTLERHFSKVPTRALLSALLHSFILFLGSSNESYSQVFTVHLLESGDSTFKQRCSCKSHAVDKHCICSKCYSCWVMYSNWEKHVLCFLSQLGILPHTLNPPAS